VNTACHPSRDLVAVKVKTSEANLANIAVSFAFPYGAETWGPTMADWQHPDRHQTIILNQEGNQIELERRLDHDLYFVRIAFSGNCEIKKAGLHTFVLQPTQGDSISFTFEFSPKRKTDSLPSPQKTIETTQKHWQMFWSSGGAIDLSQSKDPRAKELERRIVLSQYLTAIQCASSSPPQESGLTHNSWFGKSHLEMHWWHAVHFAFWDRIDLLERSLGWYQDIMPNAKHTAEMQGYSGARWPKMIGPDGRESPSGVGVFLVWQQPHPIYYAELCYRAHPNKETAQQYQDIVFETADFMASYPQWDEESKRYVLGPPLIPAQECYPPATTFNPTYEIAYWSWALKRAQEWRRRLGLEPEPKWQHVIDHLSALPQNDGVYVTTESTPDTFENSDLRRDHPSLVAALGVLPDSEVVDKEIMRRTLRKIFDDWNWESTWGWDYPMLAMTAARLGEPELAIQSLLMDTPKNHYMINGHCYQRPNLPTYLPANGGLLTAVVMMAAGWDNGPNANAPGFPADWNVRWENLKKMP
ncbi:glycoside hydrolase family 65, partial [bacterium]|nr:glycoside hydrolase family 65 [bacterium]